jgi:hypothetical protein
MAAVMDNQTNSSFWSKITQKFKKGKEESEPVKVTEPEVQETRETNAPQWISIYGHGFHNGLYQINQDDDAFPDYLKHSNELEQIIELQTINDAELNKLSAKLDNDEASQKTLLNEKAEADAALQRINESITNNKSKLTIWESRNKELQIKREHINPEYGWIPALLFLGAGILFILGDITVTADITSAGFDMTKEEGRLFAIGLALTVFLVKPLLDRLFEKPFQKAGHDLKKVYRYVLIAITGLGLTMLFFLGQFRADSKTLIAQLGEVTTKLSEPNLTEAQSMKLQQDSDAIMRSLAENEWGQWGIIFSTLVFAIGGAMCLAVAFPSLTQLCNRYWFIPFRRWINKWLIRGKEKKLEAIRTELETELVKQTKAQNSLNSLDITNLKLAVEKVKQTQMDLIKQFYQTRNSKEGHLYKDGYNRGTKYSMEGDLKFKIIDPLKLNDVNGNNAKQTPSSESETRKYTRRPFVKIRKMIADNYNKKQNHTTQDGTEFEIVS